MVFRIIHSTEKRIGKWCLEHLIHSTENRVGRKYTFERTFEAV